MGRWLSLTLGVLQGVASYINRTVRIGGVLNICYFVLMMTGIA